MSREDLSASEETAEDAAPAERAPNVLVILLDDMGFGASSAFGGPCHMPVAEQLAEAGLRYSRFHTTALCSPTRAALLTGRNHHSVGMGTITNLSTRDDGYNGKRPASKGTLAETLRRNGYATGAFGKMHQTPGIETGPVGPFTRWPTNEGFDKFYGFLAGESDQFAPSLVDGTTFVEPPATEHEGYHLSEDLVDQARQWITQIRTFTPGKPWFCYLPFGATHAPFQLPADWRGRNRGAFAHGWDRQREITLERQKALGVVPPDAELAPWAPGVPAWDDLADEDRLVAERLMEAYAAFAEHTDAQVGRLIDHLRALGELENTIVIYILGDNGASAEGGIEGTINELLRLNALPDTTERILEHLDEIGGPLSYPHYPVGWALAMDTPYQWTKQVASHYGGTRNGMIIHWPEGIDAAGEVRTQWHHVIDIAPTILEAAGIPHPTSIDGVPQDPIEGTSLLYTFDGSAAPERHTTQYFEMHGNRGIFHEGWTAVTKHRTPWTVGKIELPPFDQDSWELYDTTTDWTQAHDVAAEHPDKLAELQELFVVEATKHQVFPLDDRFLERFIPTDRPAPPSSMVLDPSLVRLPEETVPTLKNTSFRVSAQIDTLDGSADGVLVAQGGRFGGWSLYVQGGRLTYAYNMLGVETTQIASRAVLPPGRHEVAVSFDYDGGGLGRGGEVDLLVDGETAGAGRLERTVPFFFGSQLSVGIDPGTPVTEDYARGDGFAFTGELGPVTITAGSDTVTPSDTETLEASLVNH